MVVSIETEGRVAVVTIDNPPVNAASHGVRQGLVAAVRETEAMEEVAAVVLICEGRTFVAGADVREFGKPSQDPILPDVVTTLESATKPWVAAVHGTALGGGLELAMGCAYRVAVAGAKLGLPEVNLGLLPGAGGTVRLPRLVGPVKALAMMATGKPVTAQDANAHGLIDGIVAGDLRAEAVRFADEVAGRALPVPVSARPVPDFDQGVLDAEIAKIKGKARGQNSPVAVCEAVSNVVTQPPEVALAAERALFLKLKDDPQSLALRHIFFAERAAGKIDAIAGVMPGDLRQVGVIGGGTMGAGIATACLLAGLSVTMVERDANSASAGRERCLDILRGSQRRGLLSEDGFVALSEKFDVATGYEALAGADLVIEAVFEDMDVKRHVFQALDAATRADCVLASNTSYLDVAEIAGAVADPSRVIGLHFFSPAHIMKLLELVIPEGAAPRSIATGAALGKRLRKITVPAGVCDGFIGNRIMSTYRRACDYMLEDGALPHEIDAAMRDFGFPMGIFEMQDMAGLDIAWAMRKRQAATRDPSERYVEIADRLCETGRFGRKAGRGWYRYDGKTALPDPEVERLIFASSEAQGIMRRGFSADEIMGEILAVMQSEAEAILAEGIAAKPGDIDVVMVNGYSFPRWRGGPMFMKEQS